MKKFLILVFTIVFSFNAYAKIKNCKHNLDIDNNGDIITSLLQDKTYNYKDINGKLCFTDNKGSIIALPLKNGRPTGPIEFQLSDDNKVAMYMHASYYDILDIFFNNEFFNLDDLSNLADIVKNYDIKMEFYHDNGNVGYIMDLKKGNGSVISYRENGSMAQFSPVINFKIDGKAEVYDEKGKLFATLIYKNNKIISGKCADERKNGSEWTKAEISNWENGLSVDCSYF